ncbi:18798_t:CDS:2, partial [Acaulospora morrowiae]
VFLVLYIHVYPTGSASGLEHQAAERVTCAPIGPVLGNRAGHLCPNTSFVAQQTALNDKNRAGPYHATIP